MISSDQVKLGWAPLMLFVMSPSHIEFSQRMRSEWQTGSLYSKLPSNWVFEITTSTNFKGEVNLSIQSTTPPRYRTSWCKECKGSRECNLLWGVLRYCFWDTWTRERRSQKAL